MNKVKLIVDSRESYFLDEVDNYMNDYLKYITYGVERLPVGDFVIKVGDKIVAIIERKRLKDYADSFNDGRLLNQQGLINMREIHGCELFYLVEGNFVFDGDTVFSGIKYSSINNDILKLQFLHNIKIIRSGCIKHTAVEILELCKFLSLNSIPKYKSVDKLIGVLKGLVDKYSSPELIPKVEALTVITHVETNSDSSQDKDKNSSEIETEIEESTEVSSPKIGKDNIIFSVWKSLLPDVEDDEIIQLSKSFRLLDWVNGPKNNFKYDSSILTMIKSNNNISKLLSPITKTDSVKIMISVNGVSEKCADDFIRKSSLFCVYHDPKSSDVLVLDSKRKFGPARRKKVISLLESTLS